MSKLRQLIRESISDYMKDIEAAGEMAGHKSKMEAAQEAINKRDITTTLNKLDEEEKHMIDEKKVKEMANEKKALEKYLAKLQKQLDKLESKLDKAPKVEEEEEKEIVDEVEMEVDLGEGEDMETEGMEYEEKITESFLHMQKLAGVITEAQYKTKRKALNEDVINLTYNTDSDDLKYVKNILKKAGVLAKVVAGTFDDEVEITVDKDLRKKAIKALKDNGFDI